MIPTPVFAKANAPPLTIDPVIAKPTRLMVIIPTICQIIVFTRVLLPVSICIPMINFSLRVQHTLDF